MRSRAFINEKYMSKDIENKLLAKELTGAENVPIQPFVPWQE